METLEVGNLLLPALAAVIAGVVAWIVSAARVRARDEEQIRRAEGRLDLAIARNRELHDSVEAVRSLLMTLLPEHVEDVVAQASARTELALENTERRLLEATARRFTDLADAIAATGETLETLARSSQRAAETLESLPGLSDEIAGTDDRVKEAMRQMSESLGPRIAEVLTDVRRSRDAIDSFQWETLRRGRPLPWEERAEIR